MEFKKERKELGEGEGVAADLKVVHYQKESYQVSTLNRRDPRVNRHRHPK